MAKNGVQQQRAGLAERSRARAGAGGVVVLGSNPAWIFGFFFFSSTFENFLSFLAGYYAGTRSAKFSVLLAGAGTVDTAIILYNPWSTTITQTQTPIVTNRVIYRNLTPLLASLAV